VPPAAFWLASPTCPRLRLAARPGILYVDTHNRRCCQPPRAVRQRQASWWSEADCAGDSLGAADGARD
jgi:hypothetical protein